MKVSGQKTKRMGKESICTGMAHPILESGVRISSMDMGLRNGRIPLITKATT